MLLVTRQWRKKSGKTGVSVDELLRELLGGEGRAAYACVGDPRLGQVDISVWRPDDKRTFHYRLEDTGPSEDLCFVADVITAIKASVQSKGPWSETPRDVRSEFFLSALDLKSRVSVKDLVATYDLMAETGKSLPVLVGELGLV